MSRNQEILSSKDLTILVETGRELAAQIGLNELLAMILRRASTLTDSPDASVILFSKKRSSLYFAQAIGESAPYLLRTWGEKGERNIPLNEKSKALEVFSTGRSIRVDKLAADPGHFKGVDRATKKTSESMVCVALSVGGEKLGVVQILNKRSGNYTERDQLLLEHFAAQAAVAIRNAGLFNDLLSHMGLYAGRETNRTPNEVLGELNRPAQMERLSVLFADMRGFTQLCHQIQRPEQTQELLNEYLATLANCVIEHDGIVNKFLGDGLMALFRNADYAKRAVECAYTMLERFFVLVRRWHDEETNVRLDFLDLGIGIVTDDVIIGSIGSDHVRDFTAIGTAVNLAAQFTEHAREGKHILTDRNTFRATKDLVTGYLGPERFDLTKPGQRVPREFEYYYLQYFAPNALHLHRSAASSAPMDDSDNDVFISYSHKDKAGLDALRVHLEPYLRRKSLTVWDDSKLEPGSPWRERIRLALQRAKVAVLLVSPNFLASDFVASDELPPLLDAAKRGGLKIHWVPLSACSFEETEIGKYQASIDPARPIDSLNAAEQNQAWVRVCQQIKSAVGS